VITGQPLPWDDLDYAAKCEALGLTDSEEAEFDEFVEFLFDWCEDRDEIDRQIAEELKRLRAEKTLAAEAAAWRAQQHWERGLFGHEMEAKRAQEERIAAQAKRDKQLKQLEEARKLATPASRRKVDRDELLRTFEEVSKDPKFASAGRVEKRQEVARRLGVHQKTVLRNL
jgi:hypothetical protein